jgi:ParB family transcriptional regulator, chromosome partitioning protein
MPKHAPAESRNVQLLPVDLVHPGTYQARKRFDASALEELAGSIAESGVVQPVVVRSHEKGYELLAGERRWRAAQLAGLHEIPAIVRDDLDEREALVLGLIENLQRESLSPMETARGLRQLGDSFSLTHEVMSKRVGKSRAYITNFLRLLTLNDRVQEMVDEGKLSLGHAKVLAGVPSERQTPLALATIRKNLSVRALENLYKRSHVDLSLPAAERRTQRDLAKLQDALSSFLGNPVNVEYDNNRQRGEIRIRFNSLDEFEGILDKWGFRKD